MTTSRTIDVLPVPGPGAEDLLVERTVRVQAVDDAGALVHDTDVSTDHFHMVTGVREHEGRVWLGSLHEPAIAVVDV
jgi:hypothetical protein